MHSVHQLLAQSKNVFAEIASIVLILAICWGVDLYEIWSDVKDDWRQTLVCTAVAVPIFAIGYSKVLQHQVELGYFLMVLSLIPGAPGLRFWFLAWRDGARRTMEVH